VIDSKVYDIDTDSESAKNKIIIWVRSYSVEMTKRNVICFNRDRTSETVIQIVEGSQGNNDSYGNFADGVMFKLRQTNPIYSGNNDQADETATIGSTGILATVIDFYTFSESDTVWAGLLGLIEPLTCHMYVRRNIKAGVYHLDLYIRELDVPSASTTKHTLIYNATGTAKCIILNKLKKTSSEGDYNFITVRGSRKNNILGLYDGRANSSVELTEKTITLENITGDTLANIIARTIYDQDHAERLEGFITCEGIKTFMIEPGDVCTIIDPDSGFDSYYARVKRIQHNYQDDGTGIKYTTRIEFDKGLYRTGKTTADILIANTNDSRFRNDNELIDECIIPEKDSVVTSENLNIDFSPYTITAT
jgi:hypothetical protein